MFAYIHPFDTLPLESAMSRVQSGLSAKQGIFCMSSTSQIPYEFGLMYNLVRALIPLPHDAVHGLHSLLHIHPFMAETWHQRKYLVLFTVHEKSDEMENEKEMKDELSQWWYLMMKNKGLSSSFLEERKIYYLSNRGSVKVSDCKLHRGHDGESKSRKVDKKWLTIEWPYIWDRCLLRVNFQGIRQVNQNRAPFRPNQLESKPFVPADCQIILSVSCILFHRILNTLTTRSRVLLHMKPLQHIPSRKFPSQSGSQSNQRTELWTVTGNSWSSSSLPGRRLPNRVTIRTNRWSYIQLLAKFCIVWIVCCCCPVCIFNCKSIERRRKRRKCC